MHLCSSKQDMSKSLEMKKKIYYRMWSYYCLINFLQNTDNKHPHSSPVRVSYGVCFVRSNLCSDVVIPVLYRNRDLIPKSHNASVPYPIVHKFVTEICTCVHIAVSKWCIVG